jgi:1-acyl-sn-glycerol-3-phosphate acyltransferase
VRGLLIDPHDLPTRAFLILSSLLARYHRHQVLHLDRLTHLLASNRRVILVGNHALDIVDPLLFIAHLYRACGSVPRFVGHEAGWFRIPILRDISAKWQVIPSRRPEETARAIERDGLLMLFPGGNSEAALRSYRDEPYRLRWEGRTGFLRLALEHDCDVVFVAAVGNDEAYYQSRVPTPRPLLDVVFPGAGRRYVGMPLCFGLAGVHVIPGVFPLPVRLTHVVSHPLDLHDRERALADPGAFAALHRRAWAACQTFLDTAVAGRRRYSDPLDVTVRTVEGLCQGLGL